MNSSNKDYYNTSQKIINHGTSKTFYMNQNTGNLESTDSEHREIERQQHRKTMVEYIMTFPAADLAEEFYFPNNPFSAIKIEDSLYIWDRKNLEDHDDLALIFKFDHCKTLERINKKN